MTSARKLCCCIWILLLALGSSALADRVHNASFEDPETVVDNPFNDLAAAWGRWGHWLNRESSWSPTRSGGCLMGYHHWRIEDAGTSGIYQDIPDVPANSVCTFTIHAFKDVNCNAESVEVRLEKRGGFKVIASQKYSMLDLRSEAWDALTVSGTNQEEGIRLLVIITPAHENDRHGAIKFDDASLVVE